MPFTLLLPVKFLSIDFLNMPRYRTGPETTAVVSFEMKAVSATIW